MLNFGSVPVRTVSYTVQDISTRQQLYEQLPTPAGEIDIYMISLIAFIGLLTIAMIVRD